MAHRHIGTWLSIAVLTSPFVWASCGGDDSSCLDADGRSGRRDWLELDGPGERRLGHDRRARARPADGHLEHERRNRWLEHDGRRPTGGADDRRRLHRRPEPAARRRPAASGSTTGATTGAGGSPRRERAARPPPEPAERGSGRNRHDGQRRYGKRRHDGRSRRLGQPGGMSGHVPRGSRGKAKAECATPRARSRAAIRCPIFLTSVSIVRAWE